MKSNDAMLLHKIKLTVVISLLGGCLELCAQEARFKALFIYKFVDYIQWPHTKAEIVIGVYGSEEILSELKGFASAKEGVKVLSVQSPDDISKLHIFYAPQLRLDKVSSMVSALNGQPVLIISDSKSSLQEGADIGFYLAEGKLRFAIRKKAIENKKMIPSSKLLALGEVI